MLRRLLTYAQKLVDLQGLTARLHDTARRRPQIPTATVARAVLAMLLGRLGSFNALEQTRPHRFWREWLGAAGELPSADTCGRVCAGMDLAGIRALQHELYRHLKRRKALAPPAHGLMVAVLDGHETHATRRRCCGGCLTRVLHTQQGDVTEYYHRLVHLLLVGQDAWFQVDAEPLGPGEDEVAAARRLLDRVLTQYPRAFDVVAGDSLYARGDWFNFVKARGKDAIAVLKDEQRDLFQDAQGLWTHVPPQRRATARGQREDWDLEGLTTWPQCHHPVRVVRSRETWAVRRQLTKQVEAQVSTWVWVTTLLRLRAGTGAVVQIGHWRWHIENQGFNQLVNTWHADHVYRHQEQAMLVLWLWTLVALNLFAAFWRRNLQPEVRADCSRLHVARQVQAELYADLPLQPRGP